MSAVVKYFNEKIYAYALDRDEAIRMAEEWLSEHPEAASVTLEPLREPLPSDFRPDVFDWLEERAEEDELLAWDGGRAHLYAPTAYMSQEGRALKAALDAYIAAHIELGDAAWPPAENWPVLEVTRDGVSEVAPADASGGEW